MSFKDGIPLLTTLDDEDDEDAEEDLAVEVSSRSRYKWRRKHLLFAVVLALVVFVLVAIIVIVTVPLVALKSGGETATNGNNGESRSTTVSLSPSHSPSPSPSPSPTPSPDRINRYKPALDKRQYKVLTLDNSLQVLLISDPKSNISAASMEVAAGSFSDPPEAEGLAHFCEHMLFLGTEKYPDEHVYSNFLQSHGGGDNAFTSTQETNYYFSVDASYLEHALDLFAQFFIAPLFNPSSVEGEVHAVNAEHEKNLQSDGWKIWQLLKHVSNPQHPFHMFSTGTLSTLNSSNTQLLSLLKTYYNTSYSANTMQLVVYGRDSLEVLAGWVETSFTDIPNRSISPQSFQTTAFPPEYSNKLVYYYPVADTNTLTIYWQTVPLESLYRNDVTEFFSHYVGSEGPGSVLQYLKQQSWATSLVVGSAVDADSFSVLGVSMELTEQGLAHVSEIVLSVFQFIRLLTQQTDLSLQVLWEDHVAVSQVVYDYSEPQDPSDYAQRLAQKMRLVSDPTDFLGNPRRLVFNETLILSVLEFLLSPEHSLIFLGTHHVNFSDSLNLTWPHDGPPVQHSPNPYPWPNLNQTEPIYTTPFAEISIPPSLEEYWSKQEIVIDSLHLPESNHFIPIDFNILSPPSTPTDTPVRVNITRITSGVSLWWLQDTSFLTPHVNMYCTIEAGQPNVNSVRWSELTTLYTLLVTEVLTPILYPAVELTYSTSFYATPTGLQLELSGFSDPSVMETYINATITKMKDYSAMREVFDIVQQERVLFLQNYKYTTLPYSYIFRYLQQVMMERPYWKHEEEVNETLTITTDDVIAHAEALFSDASFLCFAHGNINQTQAEVYTELIVNALSPSPSLNPHPRGGYHRQRVNLTEPGIYSVTLPTLNPNDQNSAVNVVFQIGAACTVTADSTCSSQSVELSAHLGLLGHLVGDECFYQLRTVEQLGYVVFCFQTTYSGIASFQVLVQSQEYNVSYVLGEIDQFLENFGASTITNFTKRSLGERKSLYASLLRQKSQTLTEESDRLWSEIAIGREQFDFNNQLINTLDAITPDSLLDFYTRYITDSAQYRKLVVGVYGEGKMVDLAQDSTYCLDYDTVDHSVLDYPLPNGGSNCAVS